MSKEQDYVVDVLVALDGQNPSFYSYMYHQKALELQEVGLANAECVNLRETTDRKIPESLKNGTALITDVMVRIEPNTEYNLN